MAPSWTVGWDGDDRFENLVAWCWEGDSRWLIIVNLSDAASAGHVHVPWADLRGSQCTLVDHATGVAYERTGDDLCDGLFVELGPWWWHLFGIQRFVSR